MEQREKKKKKKNSLENNSNRSIHVGCKHLWREVPGNTPPALLFRWKSWLWSFWRQHDKHPASSPWPFISVNIASVAEQFASCDRDERWFFQKRLSTGLHCFWQCKWTNKSGPAGEILLRGPRKLASFYCCIAISVVFLIDLYHLHWHEREQTTPPTSLGALICQATQQKLCLIHFFPRTLVEVSFLSTASLLLAGREARSRCSIKWQQFRKVDWTRLPDGPRGWCELWGKWFSQRYLAEVILAFPLM